jgi:hypothetical protein
MVLPQHFHHHYVAVKYFLNSYRALSDGVTGVSLLEQKLNSENILFSDWKILWIGTCSILRTSIDLFQMDAKSCISVDIRKSIKEEWGLIKSEEEKHSIYWNFLKKERDQILHEYSWAAYETWLHEDGSYELPKISLLAIKPDTAKSVLMMRHGFYQGRNSLELLKEGADWVEQRIFNAIERAGFKPEEQRRLGDFQLRVPLGTTSSLIG